MSVSEFMAEIYKTTSLLEQLGIEITPELQKAIEKQAGLQNYINEHCAGSILSEIQLKSVKEQVEAAITKSLRNKIIQ